MFAVCRKSVIGAPGDWAVLPYRTPVGAVRNLLVYAQNHLMAYVAYLAAKDAGRL
jgi:hypothetical protein